jgi:hypothetical protein
MNEKTKVTCTCGIGHNEDVTVEVKDKRFTLTASEARNLGYKLIGVAANAIMKKLSCMIAERQIKEKNRGEHNEHS